MHILQKNYKHNRENLFSIWFREIGNSNAEKERRVISPTMYKLALKDVKVSV